MRLARSRLPESSIIIIIIVIIERGKQQNSLISRKHCHTHDINAASDSSVHCYDTTLVDGGILRLSL